MSGARQDGKLRTWQAAQGRPERLHQAGETYPPQEPPDLGIPHAGSAKDPDLTSPARWYLAMITPLGEVLLSIRLKPAWRVPAAKSLRPLPIVTGKILSHSSSTRSFSSSV